MNIFIFLFSLLFIIFTNVYSVNASTTVLINKSSHNTPSYIKNNKNTAKLKRNLGDNNLQNNKNTTKLKRKLTRKPLILTHPFSDFPITHNYWIEKWLHRFQNNYSQRFRTWLERSYRYAPLMKQIFKNQNLPSDLVYLAMIESGFSPYAVSSAKAVGYWQFIKPTALLFGLQKNKWLDERRDFEKSTQAAAQYLKILYKRFGNWYLAAASYNMGETRLSYFIKKYKTKDFWRLAQQIDFPSETAHYIPQLIAAITIAKAPPLYGFNHLKIKMPHNYEIFYLPGGTNLRVLASHIKTSYKIIKNLNPALLKDYIPRNIENWRTRIPKGSGYKVSRYVRTYLM